MSSEAPLDDDRDDGLALTYQETLCTVLYVEVAVESCGDHGEGGSIESMTTIGALHF